MIFLVLGLILFLGSHSVRIFADDWRTARVKAMGLNPYKGLYSLIAIAGFVLLIYGYGQARMYPVQLYDPPLWTRHLAGLLTLPAFVLLAAAYVPGNRIKAAVGHPMVLGVKVWAFAHLIANGTLAGVLLFGSILVWAILDFRSARRRDRIAVTKVPLGNIGRDLVTVGAGVAAWAAFAFWLHAAWIGVAPFG
jgi:uncharacterized membrane protein